MRKLIHLISATVCLYALPVFGQSDPLATETKQSYERIKRNFIAAAEKMPEEHYGFQATPDVRSFGGHVAHIADSQMRSCSNYNGAVKQADAGSMTAKADLVAAIKASFAECDKAYNSLTDANGAEMIAGRRGERSRYGTLNGNVTHANEVYGSMAVYLRLKGVVPPSSEGRAGGRGKGARKKAGG